MTAALDLATVLTDRLAILLEANTELAGLQILKPESDEKIRLPSIRLQAEVVGPAPGWKGSAHAGVWTLYAWVSVIIQRKDSTAAQLRNYEAAIRDTLFAEHQNDYSGLTTSSFKVWQIEFEPVEYQQDDSHDIRAQPMRIHCAVFTA